MIPEGNQFVHVFDGSGRLTEISDEEGGYKKLSKQVFANGEIETTVQTAENNITTYLEYTDSTGAFTSTVNGSAPNTEIVYNHSTDGFSINEIHPDGMVIDKQYDIGVVANGYKPVSQNLIESWIARYGR